MFTWTYNTPNRDGDLSNDIIVHEFAHGLTNRMTGGGTGRHVTVLFVCIPRLLTTIPTVA